MSAVLGRLWIVESRECWACGELAGDDEVCVRCAEESAVLNAWYDAYQDRIDAEEEAAQRPAARQFRERMGLMDWIYLGVVLGTAGYFAVAWLIAIVQWLDTKGVL
jgi:hypothetical protein